jgi:hypothetical protein
MTDALTQPRRIRFFKIALSNNTFELPWQSRTRLLDRIGKHNDGLKLRLAFEAVGAPPRAVPVPQGRRRPGLQLTNAFRVSLVRPQRGCYAGIAAVVPA